MKSHHCKQYKNINDDLKLFHVLKKSHSNGGKTDTIKSVCNLKYPEANSLRPGVKYNK